jgi:pimeloyl-ACP methyl ester carboxylesterase
LQSVFRSQSGERAVMAAYDATMGNWPAPATSQLVRTRYGDTFVISSGAANGFPVLLLHGAGSNSSMWVGDAGTYGDLFHVHAIDLIGEPGRSAPARPSWNGSAYGDWLGDVFSALGLERAILVGMSQGAWTALRFATLHPERVDKLVLLTPGGIVPDKMMFVLRALPLVFLGDWGIRRLNRLIFGGEPIPREVDDALTLIGRHFKPRLGKLPIFSDEELKRLTMPVLLIVGERDLLRDGRRIHRRLSGLVPHLLYSHPLNGGHALVNTSADVLRFLIRDPSPR